MESYKTVEKESSRELVCKRSRFIAYVKHVNSEQEAIGFIYHIKSKNSDARHNVFAYRIVEGLIERYSDDGEPQGTAGIPIMNLLTKGGLFNCVIVVTRYFGGVLLGTGGLLRAYSGCAALVLESSNIITLKKGSYFSTVCDYHQYGKITSLIEEFKGKVLNTKFNESVSLEFWLFDEFEGIFLKKANDVTAASVNFEIFNKGFFEFI